MDDSRFYTSHRYFPPISENHGKKNQSNTKINNNTINNNNELRVLNKGDQFSIDSILNDDLASSSSLLSSSTLTTTTTTNSLTVTTEENISKTVKHEYNENPSQRYTPTNTTKECHLRNKRARTIFTPDQLERMEQEFQKQQYVVGPERLYLAASLNLTEAQVKVWFQNRRIKWRKHHMISEQSKLHSFTESEKHEQDPRIQVDGSK